MEHHEIIELFPFQPDNDKPTLNGIYFHGDLCNITGCDSVMMEYDDLHKLDVGIYQVEVVVNGSTICAVAFIWELPIFTSLGRGLIVKSDDDAGKLEALGHYLTKSALL